MNIFQIFKENEENIDKINNTIYFPEDKLKFNNNIFNIFKQYKYLSKIKREKNIEIIYNNSQQKIFSAYIFSLLNKIPIVDEIEEKNKIEEIFQKKIAYTRKNDIPILLYHRIIETEEEKGHYGTFVTKDAFESQMKYLKENRYEPIFFKDIKNGEYKNRFGKKNIIITFDDGYKDNYLLALPILKKYKFKMVLFPVTDCSYNEWDVKVTGRTKEKKFSLMIKKEIEELLETGLIEIGRHTSVHLDMPTIREEILEQDLIISKNKLEELTKEELVVFAYPWGNNDEKSRNLVKKLGYKFAVATESGTACFSDDLYEIQRIAIYSKDDIEKFKEKVSGNYLFKKEKRREMKRKRDEIRRILKIKNN